MCVSQGPYCRSEKRGYQRLSDVSQLQLYLQIAFLQFFGIQSSMTELQMTLHPCHPKMQWCAFNKESARVFMVTYPSQEMFAYENVRGEEYTSLALCGKNLVLTILKFMQFHNLTQHIHYLAGVLLIAPTALAVFFSLSRCLSILKQKHTFRIHLKESLRINPDDADHTATLHQLDRGGFGLL